MQMMKSFASHYGKRYFVSFRTVSFALWILLIASPLAASELWFRTIHTDSWGNIVGMNSVQAGKASESNAYRMVFDADGKLTTVEYISPGTAVANPRFGVTRMEISYEAGSTFRRYTDGRGVPVADENGVWAVRLVRGGPERPEAGTWTANQVSVFNYDQYGNVITDRNGVALRIWQPDFRGRRSVERFFDADGARVSDVRGIGEVRYMWDESDRLVEKSLYDIDGEVAQADGVHRHVWMYKGTEEPVAEVRFDSLDLPVRAADGSARIEWDRNEQGLVREERHFGVNGELAPDANGVAVYLRDYDEAGNLIRQTHLDRHRIPTRDVSEVVTYRWTHYQQGNELEQLNQDAEGKLIEDEWGMASYRWGYDDRGLIVSSQSFGVDDRPKQDRWGVVRYRYTYDENRNLVEASSYGDWESLAEDASGVATYRWEYTDKNQKVAELHYDSSGNFAEDRQGIAKYTWTYDDLGRRLRQSQYGLYGQLRADPEGVAVYVWNYDNYGRITERRHYGIDNRPIDDVFGAALARWSYRSNGRPLAVSRFDRRSLPIY